MKHKDYYYLTTAGGGTATSHMIISARSKSPMGPWENSSYNPIIRTQRKKKDGGQKATEHYLTTPKATGG